MNKEKAQPSESKATEAPQKNIVLPAHISEMLISMAQRREAVKQQADADFSRDASNLITGFLAGSPDVDHSATYSPSPDFKLLVKNG